MTNNKLIPIQQSVKNILSHLDGLTITDQTTFTKVSELYSSAKTLYQSIYAERRLKTKPLEQQIKDIEIHYTPSEKTLKSLIEKLKVDITTYQNDQLRIRRESEQAIADRIGSGKGHIKLETALTKISELDTPLSSVGNLSFRDKPQLRIADLSLIPDEYWSIDEDQIFKDLKTGMKVPGAEIEIIKIPVNRN